MTSGPPEVRAGDDDREWAVTALRKHCVEGRLTLAEFAERADIAYRARTLAELDAVMTELPEPQTPARTRRRRFTFALFGRFIRRGRWRVPRRTAVTSVFGDVDLDLREARIESTVVNVSVYTLFGNVDVYVPEGVETDVGGMVLFGRRREWGRDAPRPGSPLVHVRPIALFGTIDVWRVPPGVKGSYREVIRAVQKQQKELPA
jgi:hypothetical protein